MTDTTLLTNKLLEVINQVQAQIVTHATEALNLLLTTTRVDGISYMIFWFFMFFLAILGLMQFNKFRKQLPDKKNQLKVWCDQIAPLRSIDVMQKKTCESD